MTTTMTNVRDTTATCRAITWWKPNDNELKELTMMTTMTNVRDTEATYTTPTTLSYFMVEAEQ